MPFSIIVRTNRVPALLRAIPEKNVAAVREAADFCAARAIAVAPQRTGSLAESIYVSGPGTTETDYPERVSSARQLNDSAEIVDEIFPWDVDPKSGPHHPVAIIAPSVLHGLFIEYGTRYMGPQPFLTPAAEATRNEFVNLMAQVADF